MSSEITTPQDRRNRLPGALAVAMALGLAVGLLAGPSDASASAKTKPAAPVVVQLTTGAQLGDFGIGMGSVPPATTRHTPRGNRSARDATCPTNDMHLSARVGDRLEIDQVTQDASGVALRHSTSYYECGSSSAWAPASKATRTPAIIAVLTVTLPQAPR